MGKTLSNDLLLAQEEGYPVAHVMQPAVRCIFTYRTGAYTYDYSFNPTLNTNRLQHVEQREHVSEGDGGVILLSNHDRAIPDDLTGYYVDLGWGLNTSSGIKWASADGAVSPRLWVMRQQYITGAPLGQMPQLYVVCEMAGVWTAVLNQQPVRLGTAPYYRYNLDDPDGLESPPGPFVISALTDLTVYECIKYLLGGDTTPKTGLSLQTGYNFTLDALGTQDDELINSLKPFRSGGPLLLDINNRTPAEFDTYGSLIRSLLSKTKCVIRPKPGLAFKIVYPQATDAIDETYYSSMSMGHPFYQVSQFRLSAVPNHIEIYGTDPETLLPSTSIFGEWYDINHYSGWISPTTNPTYDGAFMPVTSTKYCAGLTTAQECINQAAALGKSYRERQLSGRLIIPMDLRVELHDRIGIADTRGVV